MLQERVKLWGRTPGGRDWWFPGWMARRLCRTAPLQDLQGEIGTTNSVLRDKQSFECTIAHHHSVTRRKIRLIEVNAKFRHLKKLTCKGTLRQVFIRVYRLEIANFLRIFSHVGIFDHAKWSVHSPVASLPFSLIQPTKTKVDPCRSGSGFTIAARTLQPRIAFKTMGHHTLLTHTEHT